MNRLSIASLRRVGLAIVGVLSLLGLLGLGVSAASAQGAPPAASGRVVIDQVQIAFIGSASAGGGRLYYKGRSYPFDIGGLGIGGMGVSSVKAEGSVYGLRRLRDFEGLYGQVRAGWAVVRQGRGQFWLENGNGVVLRLRARRQGLMLALGADGVRIELR